MSVGILRIPQQIPKTQRDWEQFTRRLNEAIQHDGNRAVLAALTTISERTGTDLDTLLTYVGDTGRATDQRLLPMVNFGNVASVQDIDPLSASAGASSATVHIAAHTLHTDFGNIAYNSGSIVGLDLNTLYYIYADDPDNEGGAVTYISSTSRPNVAASTGRYLVGSITTPVSANSTGIIAASSANPIVFRASAAHGWEDGDTVQFAGLPGDFGTNLNGTQQVITVVDSDEFSIAVNGSAYAAYTTGGTATRIVGDSSGGGGGGGGWLPGGDLR